MATMSTIGYEEARCVLKSSWKYNVYCGFNKAVKAGRSLRRELFEKVVPKQGCMMRENVYVIESDSDSVNVGDILQGSLKGHAVRRKAEWGK